MKGIQNIETNRAFTLEELEQFMNDRWDTERYCSFQVGKPTPLATGKAILLPATPRHLVVVGPVTAGGLLRKKNIVVLSVVKNECGFSEAFTSTLLISGGDTAHFESPTHSRRHPHRMVRPLLNEFARSTGQSSDGSDIQRAKW